MVSNSLLRSSNVFWDSSYSSLALLSFSTCSSNDVFNWSTTVTTIPITVAAIVNQPRGVAKNAFNVAPAAFK